MHEAIHDMWVDVALKQLSLPANTATAVTIGTFDGVHIGHQKVIEQLLAVASSKHLIPIVLVFKNSPHEFFNPQKRIKYISTIEKRVAYLTSLGVKQIAVLEFSAELQRLTTTQFLTMLQQQMNCTFFVLGEGAVIGSDRIATDQITQVIHTKNMDVAIVPPVSIAREAVHSSLIRDAIKAGDLARTQAMLGRKFVLSGSVIKGDMLGRKLGFPTANLGVEHNMVIPSNGVYATLVRIKNNEYASATAIGVRPTVSDTGIRTVETYIINFDDNIYGQLLELEFVQRLRNELKFSNVEQLKKRMAQDVKQAQTILAA